VEAAVSATTRWIYRRHVRHSDGLVPWRACHYSSTPSSDGMGFVLPRWTMTKESPKARV